MKIVLFFLFFCLVNVSAKSPNDILELINKKDYDRAYSESKKLIYKGENKDEYLYTNILSIAGLHFTGDFSEEKIENINIEYKDKNIKLDGYSLSSGECNTNCFRFLKEDPPEIYMVKTFLDSKNKPAIVLMVYVELKNQLSKNEFNSMNNKTATISGKVKEIDLSGKMYKRMNLRIYDAELELK